MSKEQHNNFHAINSNVVEEQLVLNHLKSLGMRLKCTYTMYAAIVILYNQQKEVLHMYV